MKNFKVNNFKSDKNFKLLLNALGKRNTKIKDVTENFPTTWNHLKKQYVAIIKGNTDQYDGLKRQFISDRKDFSSSGKNAKLYVNVPIPKEPNTLIEYRSGSHKNMRKNIWKLRPDGYWYLVATRKQYGDYYSGRNKGDWEIFRTYISHSEHSGKRLVKEGLSQFKPVDKSKTHPMFKRVTEKELYDNYYIRICKSGDCQNISIKKFRDDWIGLFGVGGTKKIVDMLKVDNRFIVNHWVINRELKENKKEKLIRKWKKTRKKKKKKKEKKEKFKKVYINPNDKSKTKVPISKKGDPIKKSWTLRMGKYKGNKRWLLVRKKNGKIQKRVAYDKRYSERIPRKELLKAHKKRSEHAKKIDASINAKEYKPEQKVFRESDKKQLNRIDLGGHFNDRISKKKEKELIDKHGRLVHWYEDSIGKNAIWGDKLTKGFKSILEKKIAYERETGKNAVWGGNLTKGFKKFMKQYSKKSKSKKRKKFASDKKLIKKGEELLSKSEGWLTKRSKSILTHELEKAKYGKEHELEEFIPIIEKKYKKRKKRILEKQRKERERTKKLVKKQIEKYTKEELENELSKLRKKDLEYMKRWNEIRPDERTQRKARLQNRIKLNVEKIKIFKSAIENYSKEKAFQEKHGDLIKWYEKTTDKNAVWGDKLTKDFRKILSKKIAYELKGKKAFWGGKMTKGFKKYLEDNKDVNKEKEFLSMFVHLNPEQYKNTLIIEEPISKKETEKVKRLAHKCLDVRQIMELHNSYQINIVLKRPLDKKMIKEIKNKNKDKIEAYERKIKKKRKERKSEKSEQSTKKSSSTKKSKGRGIPCKIIKSKTGLDDQGTVKEFRTKTEAKRWLKHHKGEGGEFTYLIREL